MSKELRFRDVDVQIRPYTEEDLDGFFAALDEPDQRLAMHEAGLGVQTIGEDGQPPMPQREHMERLLNDNDSLPRYGIFESTTQQFIGHIHFSQIKEERLVRALNTIAPKIEGSSSELYEVSYWRDKANDTFKGVMGTVVSSAVGEFLQDNPEARTVALVRVGNVASQGLLKNIGLSPHPNSVREPGTDHVKRVYDLAPLATR